MAEREPALDGLRAVAALAVVAGHADAPLVGGGFRGVEVFFVLSGYLITGLLKEQGRIDLRDFWARRLRRLVPALLAMLAGALALSSFYPRNFTPRPFEFVEAATYTFNLGLTLGQRYSPLSHTWTLASEMQFYLLWPLVLPWVLQRKNPRVWILGLYGLGTFLRFVLYPHHASISLYSPWTRTTGLALGAWLALGAALPRRLGWLGLAMIVLSMISGFMPSSMFNIGNTASEIGTVLVIQHVVTGPSRLRSALSARLLVDLGLISYGIYLWHMPVMALVWHAPWWIKLPIGAWGGICLAAASYVTVERWTRAQQKPLPTHAVAAPLTVLAEG